MVYDEQGLVTEMQSYGRGCKVFVRDGLGRVTEIWDYTPNDPDRHRLRCRITYDEQARTMIMWTDDGEIEENALRKELTFDEQGRLSRYYYYNNTWYTGYVEYIYEYDASGRLEGFHGRAKDAYTKNAVEAPITFKYQYDK